MRGTPGIMSVIIGSSILGFGVLYYLYLKFLIMISGEVMGLLIGIAITLLTTGLNEVSKFYSSTTELRKPILDLEVFSNEVYRISALLRNPGNVIVRDAKAVIELENLNSKTLSDILVKDCSKCSVKCRAGTYLVNRVNPRIKGEPLPWATPEKPVERPVLTGLRHAPITRTDYVHITSISPHQTARLLLFEFIPLNSDRYLIRFFSEYGAPGPADPSPRYYRACLYLDKEIILKIRVTVAGNIGFSEAKTVTEVGLYYGCKNTANVVKDYLLARDLVSPPVSVPAGATLTIKYTWVFN